MTNSNSTGVIIGFGKNKTKLEIKKHSEHGKNHDILNI